MPKPTLVMIHGLVGSLRYFSPVARLPDLDVHAPDLLGYGALSGRHLALDLAAQVTHIIEQIERLSRRPAWVLGHSMGGAIAMMVADRRPDLVSGLINVEGNFTLADAFWSRSIASTSEEAWAEQYRAMRGNVPAWVRRCGLEPSPQIVEWATEILDNQPAATLRIMSRTLIDTTGSPDYLDMVRRIVGRGPGIHLIAGERSAGDWDVPPLVREAACSSAEIVGTGHLMMLEAPDEFCRVVDRVVHGAG